MDLDTLVNQNNEKLIENLKNILLPDFFPRGTSPSSR